MRLGSRFQELKDLLVLFRSEISTHAHVHHSYFPLCRAVVAGRSDIVTTDAVFRPEFRPAFPRGSGSDLSWLPISSATDQPGQCRAGNNDHSSGQTDPLADSQNKFFHKLEAHHCLHHKGVLVAGASVLVIKFVSQFNYSARSNPVV